MLERERLIPAAESWPLPQTCDLSREGYSARQRPMSGDLSGSGSWLLTSSRNKGAWVRIARQAQKQVPAEFRRDRELWRAAIPGEQEWLLSLGSQLHKQHAKNGCEGQADENQNG